MPTKIKRTFVLFALLFSLLTACATPSTPLSTTVATASPLAAKSATPALSTPSPSVQPLPTGTPDEIDRRCCQNYRIAMVRPPATLNYWRYLGETNDLWTAAVIGAEAPSLYENPPLRNPDRPDFVPALAADLPPEAEQRGDFWVIPVRMLDFAAWSDDEPVTAEDVVFTVQTALDLRLGGRWAEFYPREHLAKVQARGKYTVEFYFYEPPALSVWQFAAALGPILPKRYWEPYVAQAYEHIAGIEPPENCDHPLDDTQAAACQSYARARQTLYNVEPVSPPSGGGYATVGYTSSRTIRREQNPYFYASGVRISEYANGTWERLFPDGTVQHLYGEPQGEPLVSYRRGPYSPAIEFLIFGDLSGAYEALLKGRVDYVFDPQGVTNDLSLQIPRVDDLERRVAPQNGLVYLAFNLRHPPFDHLALRQALDVLLNRQRVVEKDLQGLGYPAYSIVPPENAFWWNPSLQVDDKPESAQGRLDLAVQILQDAGYAWKTEPSWNSAEGRAVPGEGLRAPDGVPVPDVRLLFPPSEENLLMAAFGQDITDWLTVLGIPTAAESMPRESIIGRAFIAGSGFDLYILDWQFPLYPGYLCDLFYSANDTLLTGGLNSIGYNDPRLDTICESFLAAADPEKAQDLAWQLQSVLAADLPYLPLFYPQVLDLARDDVIFPYWPALGGVAGERGFHSDTRVLQP